MFSIDNLKNVTKEQALRNFEIKQERQMRIGRIIVFIIALVNIISSIFSAFVEFNFISLIVQIALSIALFSGVTWVRYFFAVGTALSAVFGLYALFTTAELPIFSVVYVLAITLFSIISSILLFANKCVDEFLYSQKNG